MPQPNSPGGRAKAERRQVQAVEAAFRPGEGTRQPPKQVGRLLRYSIKGLFGHYEHKFDLAEEGPTVLTGPNGSGKTTVLKTINAIGAGEWTDLLRLPFRSLTLKFEDGPQLRVDRNRKGLKVTWGKESWLWGTEDNEQERLFLEESAAFEGRTSWPDPRGVAPSPAEIRRRQAMRRHWLEHVETQMRKAPAWIRDFDQRFPVRFITDQRLVIHTMEGRPNRPGEIQEDVRKAVSEYGYALGRRMSSWLTNYYARTAQLEDRSFPELIIRAMSENQDVDEDELQGLLDDVASKRAALEAVGLVEAGDPGAPTFEAASLDQKSVRIVIKTFAEVTLRKFTTLERWRRQLQLLVDFLNEHFVGKVAITAPEVGLLFELPDGQRLRPSDLSSGEQQMLVLAYQLLFETTPGTLLLIDEPEISLHVAWQNRFVEDITEMGRGRDIQFLLATHSPTLIGGRENIRRPLDVGTRP
jgi:ABC-type transport system involved in cytochrome c biogenesis ATPase subunit